MPSSGETRPAIQAGTNIASSETLGPSSPATRNGSGVMHRAGMAVGVHPAHRLRQQVRPAQPGRGAEQRADHAHDQPFQSNMRDDLPARGADRPQHGQLPPPLADVHQERVQDRDERQGDHRDVGEDQPLFDLLDVLLRELRAGSPASGRSGRRGRAASAAIAIARPRPSRRRRRSSTTLTMSTVAGLGEEALGGRQGQEDDAALVEAGRSAGREQADDP